MDIHKPKPWHGVREFLKEYLIIVVGVLTALAAEQGVEWAHWQEKVRGAETRERYELSTAYAWMVERAHVEKCLDMRLDTILTALLAPGDQWKPLPPMDSGKLGPVALGVPLRPWSEEVWRSLVAEGTVTHLGEKAQPVYAGIYAGLATLRERNAREVEEAAAFSALLHPLVLGPAQREGLIERLEQERERNHMIALGSRQVMQRIEQITTVEPYWQRVLKSSPIVKSCVRLGLPV